LTGEYSCNAPALTYDLYSDHSPLSGILASGIIMGYMIWYLDPACTVF